jgi:NAD(P)H-hydrate epimerase
MKIFTAEQIRAADAYTIANEPVRSIDLMERAAAACSAWLQERYSPGRPVYIFCGTGNNGGDGLAIARLLDAAGYRVHCFLVFFSEHFSADCAVNRTRLEHAFGSRLRAVHAEQDLPSLDKGAVLVDALFGTGLNRPLKGLAAEVVAWMNRQRAPVVSIDMPSGLMADRSSAGGPVVEAGDTLSFAFYKLAFLMAENARYTGRVHLLPIGIHPGYIARTPTPYRLTEIEDVRRLYRPRSPFAHKGTYGHSLLIAGSFGKMGAAVLAAGSCARSGTGLVSCQVPGCGYQVMQTAVPEAMCIADPCQDHWSAAPGDLQKYDAIGLGPGLGRHPETAGALEALLEALQRDTRLVADADALNIIGSERQLLESLPPATVITPHPKEFGRLFGSTADDFERLGLQREMSRTHQLHIVLKGHYTSVTTPAGDCFFNSTGNAGMATGGSGDVLTGILTGLLAQGYEPAAAAVLGVYLHGLAGDHAAARLSAEAMIASDITACLGAAFRDLAGKKS